QQWEKALGVHVEIKVRDRRDHLHQMREGNYDIGRLVWHAHYLDPLDVLAPFANSPLLGGINETRWDNPSYRELLEQACKEPNTSARQALYRQAEAILMEEMPVIPLFSLQYSYCLNPRLHDVVFSPLGTVDFRWAHLE